MANDMCNRRLTRELQAIQKNPMTNPRVYTTPLESNILEWHYVIEGSKETPYEGGFYWGKLIFPKEYPLKPPSVMMLTPNGRFKTGRRLCLSMSDFHPESWNPMWSVSTIITGLISFMVESAPTLGSIESTTAQKRQYAKSSLEFNVKDTIFCKLFPDLVTLHNELMEERRKYLLNCNHNSSENGVTANITSDDNVRNFFGVGLDGDRMFAAAGLAGALAVLSFFVIFRFL
jgi:ubiquitin-conjugating enzyme E2 J2